MLTVFVVSSLLLYCRAVFRGSNALKILAGIIWGLAIATKPTAVFLPLIFVLFNCVRRYLMRNEFGNDRMSIIAYSDIAAVLSGIGVLALCYTRLWHHNSDYRVRLGIKSALADNVYSAGIYLQSNFPLLLGAVFSAFSLWFYSATGKTEQESILFQ